MKKKLTIVKAGGAIIENDEQLNALLDAFLSIEGYKILVHGGGRIASEYAEKLGVQVKMIDGRRITDDDMIDVVTMTYGGLINKKIVALIAAKEGKSIGLTGADGDCIRSVKRPIVNGMDYGWVGDIEYVNVSVFENFLAQGIIPVVAPLTHDGDSNLLNTNADTIASSIACAMTELFDVSLNFIFDLNGVRGDINDPGSLIKSMDRMTYNSLKNQGIISNGMIPKLDNAFSTIDEGVTHVRLLNVLGLSQLSNPNFDEYTIIH